MNQTIFDVIGHWIGNNLGFSGSTFNFITKTHTIAIHLIWIKHKTHPLAPAPVFNLPYGIAVFSGIFRKRYEAIFVPCIYFFNNVSDLTF